MKRPLTYIYSRTGNAWQHLLECHIKGSFISLFLLPLMFFLFTGISESNAQVVVYNTWLNVAAESYKDPCDIEKGWWDDKYLTLKNGIEDGDTIHWESCQVPWGISATDLVYYYKLKYTVFCPIYNCIRRNHQYCSNRGVRLKTFCYRVELPDDAPQGMYQLWKYEYIVCDDYCGRKYKKTYYVALYDHGAPIYQCFPSDTTVASIADLPEVDAKVKIHDVCQYVAWWNVKTEAVVDTASGDTTCFVRTWSAGDPSGNESSKSQKIWIDSDASNLVSGVSRSYSNIASPNTGDWKVYPNPAKSFIKVDISGDAAMDYHMYNGLGQSVRKGVYSRGQQINVGTLDPGLYYFQLSDRNKIVGTKKILVAD